MKKPFLFVLLLLMFACTKPDNPPQPLTLTPNNLTIRGSKNSTDSFSINYPGSWTASIEPASPWLTLNKKSGSGMSSIIVTALETNIGTTARKATVVIRPDNGTATQNLVVTQQPYESNKSYVALGGSENDALRKSVPTDDGGHISVGYTFSNDGDISGSKGGMDVWVVRYDVEGKIVWQKLFGGGGDELANSICTTTDGFLITGHTNSISGDFPTVKGDFDLFVMKIAGNGSLIWSKTYGGSLFELGTSIESTADGNFLVTGATRSIDGDVIGNHTNHPLSFQDAWILKLNSSGIIIWQKCLGSKYFESGEAAVNSPDGGFVIVGTTEAREPNGDIPRSTFLSSIVMHKLDAAGNLQWTKVFGGRYLDIVHDVKVGNDGGYLIGGYTLSDDQDVVDYKGGSDGWLIKTSENGNILWSRTYGTSENEEYITSILSIPNGYKIAGSATSITSTGKKIDDGWMFTVSNSGVPSNEKKYGGSNEDGFLNIINLKTGFFLLTGVTKSSDGGVTGYKGKLDGFLVKTND